MVDAIRAPAVVVNQSLLSCPSMLLASRQPTNEFISLSIYSESFVKTISPGIPSRVTVLLVAEPYAISISETSLVKKKSA